MKEKSDKYFLLQMTINLCPDVQYLKRSGDGIIYFSMAKNTDISAEIYQTNKIFIVADGSMEIYTPGVSKKQMTVGEAIITQTDIPVGVKTKESAVYIEINLRSNNKMNEIIKAGEVFKLAELVPYQNGKIVNMDIVRNDKMKLVVMSFDEGTGLSEHAAPGEAIIFAIDGEGVIGYEGKEHSIKSGENFHFAKGGLHFVKATKKFKIALLLTLA